MSDLPRRKLIEVALPLEAINRESAREKSIRHGHPSTLHLWWAPRPLAACRAVLFASLVDDPSSRPDLYSEKQAEQERVRLFRLIEQLVRWESTNDERVLEQARREIRRSTDGEAPSVLDPFCGGGSIPLEAQRLGLDVSAADLNPVAVLITKALVEIPPRFRNKPPVNPDARQRLGGGWQGAYGLADDVRYYGEWMRSEAEKRMGHLYPKVTLADKSDSTVIAWIWARTIKCPSPACRAEMPLVRSFALSSKQKDEQHVEPVIDHKARTVAFQVQGGAAVGKGTVDRGGARCLLCGNVVPLNHVRSEAQEGRMAMQLMATVAEGNRRRIFISPSRDDPGAAALAAPEWGPEELVTTPSHDVDRLPMYGMRRWRDAFTPRQLVALTTFSDLVGDARTRVLADSEDEQYADAIATYLALTVDRLADYGSTLTTWASGGFIRGTFARQALAMAWDFAEANPLSNSTGSWGNLLEGVTHAIERVPCGSAGRVKQLDATAAANGVVSPMICTDPPYYDNIGYADLSDYFYVWLRRSLKTIYPDLFSTVLTPKSQELVAAPHRFQGNKQAAREHFEVGLGEAFSQIRAAHAPDYPMTLFYAFKQAEADRDGLASTGWETMLEGLLGSGFTVTGTWPMRTERGARTLAIGSGALASSVLLVCRPRPAESPLATRKDFTAALRAELPNALRQLQSGSIAPVDLAQAAIGPGMAIFSRYSKVVEADGQPMRVRTALTLINGALDELLAEQEAEFDADGSPARQSRSSSTGTAATARSAEPSQLSRGEAHCHEGTRRGGRGQYARQ